MVVPGKIQWQDSKGRKRKRTRNDPASQRNAAQLKLETDEAFNTLSQFLPQGGLRQPNSRAASLPIQPYEFQPHTDNHDQDSDDDDPREQERLAQYLRSRKYREKRARNAELWNAVVPQMFVEYMRLRPKTMCWGHPDLWNHDWHDCDCRQGEVRFRDIDMVDVLSQYFFSLPFLHPVSPP